MSEARATIAENSPQKPEGGKLPPNSKMDPNQLEFVVYKGMMMPQLSEPIEVHVPKVKNFQLRDSDVLLCSYPKSGTHWLWRVLDMLVRGSAEYSDRFPDNAMLDLMLTEIIDKVESPRVLISHFPADLLPEQLKDGGVKVVHVYRNPKAVMASLFFQMQATGKMPDLTFQKLEAMIFSEKAPTKNQFYYWDTVTEYEKHNPQVNIFHIAYEDMKKDTAGSIKKIAEHLGVKASDELCSEIAEAVNFNKQKQQEEKLGGDLQKSLKFYRKGEVADWKNHLTVAQSERFDQVLKERAATCPFSRRYCPAE
ncbi:amine sulfotransferase-like [Littorina saxatilis]|uniref:Sulfotransferase domain-containing protein n=1 Tax=Littorina saxatilis TaxID=31220 RepID=A0AAN9AKB9_9CAEN